MLRKTATEKKEKGSESDPVMGRKEKLEPVKQSSASDDINPGDPDLYDPELYFNRELSLLEFQRRVLAEARDPYNPLLERVKFLAIVGSNLDEFFMVRVVGLKKQVAAGVMRLPADGMPPAAALAEIRKVATQLMNQSRELFPAGITAPAPEVGHPSTSLSCSERKAERECRRLF